MDKKEPIKVSLATFFLIISIIVIIIMGYFMYKLNNRVVLLESYKNEFNEKTNTSTETVKDSTERFDSNIKKNYLYSEIKGKYECSKSYSDGSSFYELTLYENGTFKYLILFEGSTTLIGNYIIVDDEVRLNEMFIMGGGVGLNATSETLTLKINSDGTIGDTNHFPKDSKNFENIKLEKKQNNTNNLNNNNVNDLIKSQPLYNDYKE